MDEKQFVDYMDKAEQELKFVEGLSEELSSMVYNFLYDSLHNVFIKRLGYDPQSVDVGFWSRVQDISHSKLEANVGAIDLIRDYLPKVGAKIIDIGCNDGGLTKRLVQLGYDCYGVDLPITIEKAKLKWPHVADKLSVCDLEHDKLPRGFYDMALALAVLEHLRNYKLFLPKVAKALKFGGIVYLSTANNRFREIALLHTHHFSREELAEMSEQAGFKIIWCGEKTRTNLTMVLEKVTKGG